MPPPPRKKSSVQAMRPKTVSAQSAPDSTEGAVEEAAEEADSTDDLEQKISELQASGWRPPEETQDSYEDDDYNDVDLLSDNEEEAGHLRRREEQLLFAEEHFSPAAERDLARRLSLSSQGSNDSDLAYTHFNDTFLFTSDTPWSQSFHHLHPDNLVDYGNVFNDDDAVEQPTPSARRESEDSFAAQRRVRFEEDENAASDSDSTDSDPDEDLFPDLFVQQDQLDAGFRADIEADVQDLYMDDESETGSCWDFDADEARILMMGASNNDDSSDSEASSAGSSGYECMFHFNFALRYFQADMRPFKPRTEILLMKKRLSCRLRSNSSSQRRLPSQTQIIRHDLPRRLYLQPAARSRRNPPSWSNRSEESSSSTLTSLS